MYGTTHVQLVVGEVNSLLGQEVLYQDTDSHLDGSPRYWQVLEKFDDFAAELGLLIEFASCWDASEEGSPDGLYGTSELSSDDVQHVLDRLAQHICYNTIGIG